MDKGNDNSALTKEGIRLECLKLAETYAEFWSTQNKGKYKTAEGVVEIANRFVEFVDTGL